VIDARQGVAITHQQSWVDCGIEETAFELRWLTEPGSLTLQLDGPTLCMMAAEIGGRCEFRAAPDRPTEGEYFGLGVLAFAAHGSSVTIRAAEMRHARLCCFALRATDAGFLSAEEIAAISRLASRYMFPDERIRTCAALLDRGRMRGDAAAYLRSLSKALFAAILEMGRGAPAPSKDAASIGAAWDAIAQHIRNHFDEPITIEALAQIARMPAERFGGAFRDVTGMSVRQWQMDHRVRSAQRLLVDNPNESLAEEATQCGFADPSHFTRAFLKEVGLTPTA
jgi:AraC-like DNA-binding protein